MSRRSRSRGQLLSVLEVVLDNTNTTPNSTATNDEGANGSSSCLSSHGDNEDEDMRPLSALRSLTRIDKRRKNETLLAKTSTKDSGRSESGSNQVDLDFHLDSDQDDEDLNSGDGDLNDDDDKEDDADFVAESSSSSSSSSSARNTRRVLRAETPHTKSSARSKSTQFIMGGAASVLSLATRRHSVSVCSNIRRRAILDEEEEEEGGIDDREETSNKADYRPFRRRTPSRASAVKATRNFGDSAWTRDKDEADDDDDTVDCKPMAQKNRKTKRNGSKHNKKADDDDDEFVLESDDQEDEENLSDGGSSSSSQQDNNDADSKQGTNERGLHEENRRNSHVGIVQEGEIGDADEDEEDENASRTKNYRPTYRSPQLVVVQPTVRRRSNGTLLFDCESSDDNYDTDMNDDDNVDLVCTQCQSMRDVVTDDDLPTRHVCFFPPDQKNPQCFALETLRKIALTAAHPSYRTDRNGQQIQTFLQPPHFRTALSDNLLDQIASRFGRDALDLHGSYYGRKDENNGAIPSNWSAAAAAAATHPQGSKSDTFIEQLERYIRNRMGHQDVYCCPLCYIATHCQLVSIPKDANDHSSEEENDDHSNTQGLERYSTEFTQDPMTVLGYLDNDAFRIASTFCFTKVAALKEHLRKDHNVDTKKVQGNELYARFKVSNSTSIDAVASPRRL